MTKTVMGLMALSAMALSSATAVAGPYRYDARAQALFVKNDSGPLLGLGVVETLPRYKDSEETDVVASANLAGYLTTGTLRAHAEAFEGKVRSTARIDGLHILPAPLFSTFDFISAASVKSVTTDTASGSPKGFSEFEDLKILGQPFEVTGEPNQKLSLNVAGVGKVQLLFNAERVNEAGSMTHVALRITLPTGELMEICKSVAGCTFRSPI